MNQIEKNRQKIYDAIVKNMECEDPYCALEGYAETTDAIIDMLEKNITYVNIDNLYDQQKFEVLMDLMKRCNLPTLLQISDIYANGALNYDKVPQPYYDIDPDKVIIVDPVMIKENMSEPEIRHPHWV